MAGCTTTQQQTGAAGDSANVLSGGPISGTKISDLPQPVKDTLEERVPNERIADIDKAHRGGKPVYIIRFAGSGHEKMYVMGDGELWPQAKAQ